MSKHTIPDEMLFAYVDNELDAATRAQVEASIAADPELAQRVEQQRSLRTLLGAAYRPVLEEAVPHRLAAAAEAAAPAAPKAKARVLDLVAARKKGKPRAADRPGSPGSTWSWMHWGGMAACLMVGVFVGRSAWLADATGDVVTRGGQLVASGQLAQALTVQLASGQPSDARVKLGVSFLSRGGKYCRTFTFSGASAGLACRSGDEWTLRVLAQDGAGAGPAASLRQASSALPPAVLKVVEEQMQGEALDAPAEREAARRGWR